MAANQRYGVDGWAERQQVVLVLEEDDALFGYLLGYGVTAFDVGNLLDNGIIKEAGSKDGADDAMDVFVDLGLGDFAAGDSFLKRVAEEVLVGLLLVEAGMRGFYRGVGAAPIGENEALEVECLL